MFDERWSRLADILVNYSTRTQPGDRLLIAMTEPETLPLALAVYEQAVRTGAWDIAFLGAEPQRAAEIAFTKAYLEIPDPKL